MPLPESIKKRRQRSQGFLPAQQAGGAEPLGPIDVLRFGQREPSRNRFLRVLDILATGQFAAAGVAEELQRRKKGRVARPFGKATLQAIRERRSFGELTGNPVSGFGLDVLIDPINLIPGTMLAKAPRLLGVTRALRAASEATDSIRSIRILKEGIGKVFDPVFDLRKHNPDEVLKMRTQHLNETAGKARAVKEQVEKELSLLVPDERRRRYLIGFLEREPIDPFSKEINEVLQFRPRKLDPAAKAAFEKRLRDTIRKQQGLPVKDDPRIVAWFEELGTLTPNERKLFDRGRIILDELEETKILSGLITKARAAGFVQASGIRYVPRIQARKGYTLERLRELEAGLLRGDPAVTATATLSNVRKWIDEIKDMEELLDVSEVERMRQFYRGELGFAKPSFLKQRKVKVPLEDLGLEMRLSIEQDLAKVLGLQSAEVARAAATRRYVTGLTKFLQKEGLMLDESLLADPFELQKVLTGKIGTAQATKRIREGFVKARGLGKAPDEIKALLKDKVIPKSIADEIEGAITAYTDPEFLQTFFEIWARTQNIWKAWTLSIFPSYHSRNFISNIWNNSLAGMGIKEAMPGGTYYAASKLMLAGKSGKFSNTKMIGKLTDKDLWKLAQNNRIVSSGEIAGELSETVNRYTDVSNWIKRIIDPASNPGLRHGFKFGRTIEDHSRLAHFMWALKKGKSVEDAQKSVFKFLFDYQYGLSAIEKKLGRNFMFPFYAWTRFNLPLQLEMLVTQPAKFSAFGKAKRAVEDQWGGPEPQEMFLAEWMKHSLNVRVRYNKGKDVYEYFMFDSWWPGADLQKIFSKQEAVDGLMNLLSPFLKVPVELVKNYNQFQKRKIEEFKGQRKQLGVSPALPGGAVLGIPGFIGGAIAGKFIKTKIPLAPRVEHLLRNVRLINETDRIIEAFDRGTFEGLMRVFIGRTYPVNFEKQEKYWRFMWNRRIGVLRNLKNREKRKIAKGEGDPGQIEVLDQQIKRIEERLKEF